MRKLFPVFIASVAITLSGCATNSQQNLADVAPYPQAQEGYQRHVIWLSAKQDESRYQVELLPGKQMLTDCNTRSLAAEMSEHNLDGWGYSYYQIDGLKGSISTLMACPDQEQTQAFVPVNLSNTLLPYNSKLPIVLYAPAEIELRYRVWSAPTKYQQAQPQ